MISFILKHQKTFHTICLLLIILTLFMGFVFRIRVYKNKEYSDKNHVALYLYKYDKLPKNYISKTEVANTSVQPQNGYYLYGIHYYSGAILNYTENTNLKECDLSYPKDTNLRGVKRLVFAIGDNGQVLEVFYTDNHYGDSITSNTLQEPYQKVTRFSINVFGNIMYIISLVSLAGYTTISIIIIVKRKDEKEEYVASFSCVIKEGKDNIKAFFVKTTKGILTKIKKQEKDSPVEKLDESNPNQETDTIKEEKESINEDTK